MCKDGERILCHCGDIGMEKMIHRLSGYIKAGATTVRTVAMPPHVMSSCNIMTDKLESVQQSNIYNVVRVRVVAIHSNHLGT